VTISTQELVAINLRYDAGNAALHTRAVGQLVAKTLFAAGKKVSKGVRDIQAEAGNLLGTKALREDVVKTALEHLRKLGLATESSSGNRWLLTDDGFDEVARDVSKAADRRTIVLHRHFPNRLDATRLSEWFDDASVEFFRLFGNEWAAALTRARARQRITRETLVNVLQNAVNKHGFTAEREPLFDGFHSFVNSTAPEDVEHIWSLGQAMLAAQLVAANISADPVTARDFEGCLFLIDTNALVVAVLEAHRLAGHVEELGRTLEQVGARVGVIAATRTEYENLISKKRDVGIRAVHAHKRSVLEESGDEFLETAIVRGSHDEEDFERFYDEIRGVPDKLSDNVAIENVAGDAIDELSERGSKDEQLITQIRAAAKRKTRNAAIHDSILTTVVEGMRTGGEKVAVVTLDYGMYEFSLKRIGPKELPTWLTLDGLIQILAVDNSGPARDPTEFAPLMASIIRHHVEPALNTYTAEDLAMLVDIEERAADLPDEDVKALASSLARARYAGKDANDPEIQLVLKRAFQTGRLKVSAALDQVASEKKVVERELSLERMRKKAIVSDVVALRAGNIKRDARLWLARQIASGVAVVVALLLGGWLLAYMFDASYASNFVQIFLTFVAFAVGVVVWLRMSVWPEYKGRLENAEAAALDEERNRTFDESLEG
jgi:hypothetical protein